MIFTALRMLFGDRAKYIGIVVGLTFASMLITQQSAIFLGFMARTYAFILDTPQPDLWVMDPEVEHHADNKQMLDTQLERVRSVEGVAWAVPMYKTWAKARLPNGSIRNCILIGIDDATLVGGPPQMVEGTLDDLRRSDAVIVHADEVLGKLGMDSADGTGRTPVRVGDAMELNDRRAVIAGTFRTSPSFFWEPTLYTTLSRAKAFAPHERRQMTFVLVKARPGIDHATLAARIESSTGMAAHTPWGFSYLTARYIVDKTGIAVNFGLAVLMGVIVGAAIAGQTFHSFTLDNLRHFAALKAMGAGDRILMKMIVTQSLAVGAIGYGLGVGFACLFGAAIGDSLAFWMPWQLLAFTAVLIAAISLLTAFLSVRPVVRLEPGVVFKA